MIYWCNNCGARVDESELESTGEYFKGGLEHGACPHCHSEDLSETNYCELCNYPIPPEHRFCVDCDYECSAALSEAIMKLRKTARRKAYKDVQNVFFDWCEYQGLL